MTAPMTLVHEGCGTGHITVDGADDDLWNALAMALDGVTEGALEPLHRSFTSWCELEDPR